MLVNRKVRIRENFVYVKPEKFDSSTRTTSPKLANPAICTLIESIESRKNGCASNHLPSADAIIEFSGNLA